MKKTVLLMSAATVLGACGLFGPDATPVEVAEAYLRAGSAANDADVRANLDPACHSNEGMTRVDAVRMMGATITIEELEVSQVDATDERATVSYSVAGPAHSSGGTQEILGVTVTTGEVNIEHAEQSGTLTLRMVDGDWRVSCD